MGLRTSVPRKAIMGPEDQRSQGQTSETDCSGGSQWEAKTTRSSIPGMVEIHRRSIKEGDPNEQTSEDVGSPIENLGSGD